MNLRQKRSLFSIAPTILIIASLLIVGCAPRAGGSSSADSETVLVDLPAIVVDYAESGEASLFDMPVSELGGLLGADLSALSFEADTVSSMMGAGIQHIQIDNQPGGLRLYSNSQPLPSLVWDDDVRANLAETLDTLGVDAGPVAPLLPLLPDMGVGLALRMPGATIPLEIPDADVLEVEEAEALLDTAQNTAPTQQMTVVYGADGSATGEVPFMLQMGGISAAQLSMPADTIASVADMGIENVSVTLLANGLAIKVNGNDMPFLQWNDTNEFNNLLGMLPVLLGPDSGIEGMLGMVPILLSLATGLNIDLTFPTGG